MKQTMDFGESGDTAIVTWYLHRSIQYSIFIVTRPLVSQTYIIFVSHHLVPPILCLHLYLQ
jgi:hypothetical protein